MAFLIMVSNISGMEASGGETSSRPLTGFFFAGLRFASLSLAGWSLTDESLPDLFPGSKPNCATHGESGALGAQLGGRRGWFFGGWAALGLDAMTSDVPRMGPKLRSMKRGVVRDKEDRRQRRRKECLGREEVGVQAGRQVDRSLTRRLVWFGNLDSLEKKKIDGTLVKSKKELFYAL